MSPGLYRPLIILFAALLVACGESRDAPFTPPKGDKPLQFENHPVLIDLIAQFPVAHADRPVTKITMEAQESRRFLTSGWHPSEKGALGATFAWIDGSRGVVDIPIVEPTDRRLVLDIGTATEILDQLGLLGRHRVPTKFAQTVRIVWNGKFLASSPVKAPRETLELDLPKEFQRIGLNRLEILPGYWFRPYALGLGKEKRSIGTRVWNIEIPPLAKTWPTHEFPAANARADSIQQYASSIITYSFITPESAVLEARAELILDDSLLEADLRGRLTATLLDERGEEDVFYSKDLATAFSRPEIAFRRDLSQYAGEAVALNLSLFLESPGDELEGSETPLSVRWEELRVQGEKRTPVHKDLPETRDPYNVFVILFDALRADFTQPYGSTDTETPQMTKLASESVTFANAVTNAPWTTPSVASMFTGHYPSGHKISSFLGDALAKDIPYLPEILQTEGYATLAIMGNPILSEPFMFQRGFDRYHPYYKLTEEGLLEEQRKDPADLARFVWDEYVAPFINESRGKPLFIYLHEIDPHNPYTPPPPYRGMYDSAFDPHLSNLNNPIAIGLIERDPDLYQNDQVRYLASQYRGEITYMDTYLGWMIDRIHKEKALKDNTLIIFVSDHGEEFAEHGGLEHGGTLYEELMRIPMIFSFPGVLPAGRRPTVPVSLVDVSPTILDLIGVDGLESAPGRSLLPYLRLPDDHTEDRPSFARSVESRYDSVRFRNWKLIRSNPEKNYGKDGHLLINMDDDPEELTNRWSHELVLGQALRQMLDWQFYRDAQLDYQDPAPDEVKEFDPALLESLRKLGYLK